MLDAFGSAGTQSAGLWEFLRDAADSKQLHTAKAAADGFAFGIPREGRGLLAPSYSGGPAGMAAGMSRDLDPAKLTDRPGENAGRWLKSFKIPCVLPAHAPGCGRLCKSVLAQNEPKARDDHQYTGRRGHRALWHQAVDGCARARVLRFPGPYTKRSFPWAQCWA